MTDVSLTNGIVETVLLNPKNYTANGTVAEVFHFFEGYFTAVATTEAGKLLAKHYWFDFRYHYGIEIDGTRPMSWPDLVSCLERMCSSNEAALADVLEHYRGYLRERGIKPGEKAS